MQRWTHVAGSFGVGHCLYLNNEDHSLAVTDDSLRSSEDPASTDDGLLLVDRTRALEVQPHAVIIPVIVTRAPRRGSFVSGSILTDLPLAVVCLNHGYTVNVSEGVERLAAQLARLTGGEANPKVYLNPATKVFTMPAGNYRRH